MRFIYAEYNMYHNSVDVTTFDGYILRIDCNVAEDRLQTTPRSQCALDALAIDEPLGKRQIIGVYKRSAAYDIVQLEHLDNQIVAKVPSYLRFLFLLRLRYRTLAHKQLLPGSMLIMQLDHCPLAFPRFGLFSGVSLDALALETAVHTMIDVAAVSSLHMSCRLLTRAPYQP